VRESERKKLLDELLDQAQAIESKNSPKISKYQSSVLVSNTERKQLMKKKPPSYPDENHVYGVRQLATDNINGIVNMQYAEEFVAAKVERDRRLQAQYDLENRKMKNVPTKTSMLREVNSKKRSAQLDKEYPEYVQILKERKHRGLSHAALNATRNSHADRMSYNSSKASSVLPPLGRGL